MILKATVVGGVERVADGERYLSRARLAALALLGRLHTAAAHFSPASEKLLGESFSPLTTRTGCGGGGGGGDDGGVDGVVARSRTATAWERIALDIHAAAVRARCDARGAVERGAVLARLAGTRRGDQPAVPGLCDSAPGRRVAIEDRQRAGGGRGNVHALAVMARRDAVGEIESGSVAAAAGARLRDSAGGARHLGQRPGRGVAIEGRHRV